MTGDHDLLKAFIVGSSLPAAAITLAYVGMAHAKSKTKPLTYEAVPFAILGSYGLANTLAVATQKEYGTNPRLTMAAYGAGMGFLFSLVGRKKYMLPTKIFGMTKADSPRVHIIAPIMYAAIFAFIIHPMNELVIHDK